MKFITFSKSVFGFYENEKSSGDDMNLLGGFLTSDVQCDISYFKPWIENDSLGYSLSGNRMILEKKGEFIFFREIYTEAFYVNLKILRNNLLKLLKDWDEKVCKKRPKGVTITFENGEYIVKTKE